MIQSLRVPLLLLLSLVLAGCSQRSEVCSNPELNPACAADIEQRLVDARVPGVSVAIVQDHRIISQWALGNLAVRDSRIVSPVTPFQAGDLSQTVTALGVLAWLEQSGGNLDIPINATVTGWQLPDNQRWSGDDVTLRHLLSHRSGLTPTRFRHYRPGQRQPTWEALLNGQSPAQSQPIALSGEPGETCHASAAGYEVLARWLEAQTRNTFPLWQQRAVFSPLNIPSRYRLIGLPSPAMGHDWQGNTLEAGYGRVVDRGASGLWASPADLARVMLEIMAAERGLGRILSDSTLINEMLTPQGCGWGLGLVVERNDQTTQIGYSGVGTGYRSRLVGELQRGHGVVVMTNGDRGDRIIDDIVAAVRRDYNW